MATSAPEVTQSNPRKVAAVPAEKRMEVPKSDVKSNDQLRKEHAAAVKKDPEAQPPQIGMSSSELNSGSPSMKKQATEEAKELPHNNMKK